MFFNKKKVRAGKQNNETPASAAKAGGNGNKKPAARFGGIGAAWKKLNSMDRKQAYTWGAVAVVAIVGLFILGTSFSSSEQEDFSGFETRGYDLANMPFSSDEAEQYLLASKYPDMQGKNFNALYSESEKKARQAEDAEAAAELDTSAASRGSEYVPGRYYGGGAGGSGARTQVGSLNSANLKGASGSGIQGSFGPTGDFSNFRSQDKGRDKFTPQGPGKGNARTALFQAAKGSRAAAGLKNDKLLNAKKAMMGSNVKGSDAFLNDSGAVSLKDARGLELDTNAPVSSADLGGLDDALQDAKDAAEEEAEEAEEQEWWKELLIDLAKQVVQGLIQIGMNATQNAISNAQAERAGKQTEMMKISAEINKDAVQTFRANQEELVALRQEQDAFNSPFKIQGTSTRHDFVNQRIAELERQQQEIAQNFSAYSSNKYDQLSETEQQMLDLSGNREREGNRFGLRGTNKNARKNVGRQYSAQIELAGKRARAQAVQNNDWSPVSFSDSDSDSKKKENIEKKKKECKKYNKEFNETLGTCV